MKLHNQVVWITGASSGIGEALALACAREGAALILSARRAEALERVADACRSSAASVQVLPMDMADLPSLPKKAQEILARYGRIDWLVHNAGVSQRARAIETSVEVDEQILRTNFLGPVALTKAVLPSMVQAHHGAIVVVSSLLGMIGTPLRSSYSASKHALHGFFDSLRAEHADDGIQITLACPGFVATEVSKNALTGDGRPSGKMDERTANGMSPEAAAAGILKAMLKGREEALVGRTEIAAVYLKRFAPGLFSRIIRRAKVV
jgi:short-subunit dehydrogenase